ncbi:hypothetical protein INT82_10635 [Mannheimia haemolytica]|nr:hypothetical protein [Mannheimia haemolytica]
MQEHLNDKGGAIRLSFLLMKNFHFPISSQPVPSIHASPAHKVSISTQMQLSPNIAPYSVKTFI